MAAVQVAWRAQAARALAAALLQQLLLAAVLRAGAVNPRLWGRPPHPDTGGLAHTRTTLF